MAGDPAPVPDPSSGLEESSDYEVSLSLHLPRDRHGPRLVRRLARLTLHELGVVDDDITDIELALSEACANVVNHAQSENAYDVTVTVHPNRCELRVADAGHGFDHEAVGMQMARQTEERGRGVALMHAVMDRVRLASGPERGTLVLLTKRLSLHN